MLSTQNKIICKALDCEGSLLPAPPHPTPPGLPSPQGLRRSPLSYIQGGALPVPGRPAPRRGARLLPASASTVGGNECLAVLVPARLSITLFYSSTGKSPPPRAIGKINPLRGRAQRSETSPRPRRSFIQTKVGLEGWGQGIEREEVA